MRTLRFVIFLLVAPLCYGQGFYSDAFDARSLGMASAPYAAGTGASTLVFNPASVVQRQGLFMNVGAMLNIRDADFGGTTTRSGNPVPQQFSYSTNNPVSAVPQFGFAYGPSKLPIGFGISVTEPFQMNTVWPSSWPGNTTVQELDVHAVYTTLALGYRVNRIISIGVGVDVVTGGFASQVRKNNGFSSIISNGAGTGAAIGASVIIAPAPQFSLALGYTSGANLPLKGTSQGAGSPSSNDAVFHSSMSLPSILNFSVDVHPIARLRVDAGVAFIGWGAFVPMSLSFVDPSAYSNPVGPTFKNATALRMGFEFFASSTLALRAGVGYTSSPLLDDNQAIWFPDAGSFNYAFGLGYQFTKNIRFDLGYRGSAFGTRNGSVAPGYNGAYSPMQHLIAASIALTFEPTANPLRPPSPKK